MTRTTQIWRSFPSIQTELILGLYLDAMNGRTYTITFSNVSRVDITPWICGLDRIQFGDIGLMPDTYLTGHWRSLNSEENVRVAKITNENDEEHFFVVYYGPEVFREVAHDDPILQGTCIHKFNLNSGA